MNTGNAVQAGAGGGGGGAALGGAEAGKDASAHEQAGLMCLGCCSRCVFNVSNADNTCASNDAALTHQQHAGNTETCPCTTGGLPHPSKRSVPSSLLLISIYCVCVCIVLSVYI